MLSLGERVFVYYLNQKKAFAFSESDVEMDEGWDQHCSLQPAAPRECRPISISCAIACCNESLLSLNVGGHAAQAYAQRLSSVLNNSNHAN